MQAQQQRWRFWSIVSALFIAGLAFAFWPRAVLVDLAIVERQTLKVTVSETADTRVHDVYTLSAPINGRLRRIEYEVGDSVEAGVSVLADIEPVDAAFLDPRSEAQAQAELKAATSAKDLAGEEVKQAEAELEFAQGELARIRELRRQNTASQRDLDNAERNFKTARALLATAHAALQMRTFELQRVQAVLTPPNSGRSQSGLCDCMSVVAPISGTVLNVITKSEGVVNAGAPLLEIGDPKDLEIVIEMLSMYAVQVSEGMLVDIDNWGGEQPLRGRVKRVEPLGFTKFSALGIEEQRVNVLVEILNPYSEWQRLGHGYQVETAVILWEQDEVLSVPITALFRQGEEWMIYVVEDGVVAQRAVQLGQKNSQIAQVSQGLEQGDVIIRYPNEQIAPGVKVESRADVTAL